MKNKGNAAFAAGRYAESVEQFSQAISLGATHVLYSNRSAAYASLRNWEAALKDAEKAIELKGDWAKGWGRKGAALQGMGLFKEAKETYQRGLELEPENLQLKKGLEAVETELQTASSSIPSVDNIFSDPKLWEKLRADPKMSSYLNEPDFIQIINELKADPKSLTKHIRDPRVMQAFATMLGVQMNVPEQPAPNTGGARQSSFPKEQPPFDNTSGGTKETFAPKSLTLEQEQAQKEKELGNNAYKKKDFETALGHYDRAISLDSENISLLTNKAAVYFEMQDYEACIALCEEAVNKGREIYADFKLIAKALGRIGSAHEKKGDLSLAIAYYQKSLTEHRTADILEKLRNAEKTLEIQEKNAYRNPQIAEQERNAGNELFKQGSYADALKHYSEAIKRDECDPRGWSNRAACYLKLAAVPEGLKDCEKAISLDPTFVKAYIRKAALLHLKRDFNDALTALDAASSADKEHKHTAEIHSMMSKIYADIQRTQHSTGGNTDEERLRNASQNPEIREILTDPVMMQILKQMQEDPRAAAEHMRNPEIATKIRKLVAAGIVKTQ